MVELNVTCLLGFLGCLNINTSSTFAQLSLVCHPFGHSRVSLTFLYASLKSSSILSNVSSRISFCRLLFGGVSLCRESGFFQRWLPILLLPPALPPHPVPSLWQRSMCLKLFKSITCIVNWYFFHLYLC